MTGFGTSRASSARAKKWDYGKDFVPKCRVSGTEAIASWEWMKPKQIMDAKGFRHLPVKDGGEVVGLLSIKDIAHALAQRVQLHEDLKREQSLPPPCTTAEWGRRGSSLLHAHM